jgi:hypothetical protein
MQHSTRVGALRPLDPRTRFEPAAVFEMAHLKNSKWQDCCMSSAPNPGPRQLRAMPRAFVLGAAALCWAADGNIARHRVLFMHVILLGCITCVRGHRRAVRLQLQRRGRPPPAATATLAAGPRVRRVRCGTP